MTKKAQGEVDSPVYPSAPIFFADQPSALMLGPHISRVSFGVAENDSSDFPRTVVTIAMPTAAFLEFINDAKAALDSADFKKHAVDHLTRAAKKIATGGSTVPAARKITRSASKKSA